MLSRVFSVVSAGAMVALSMAATPVDAQTTTYACKTGKGVAYRSDKPCPWSQKTELRYYGPAAPAPSSSRPIQRVERAGDELQYMSTRCQTMKEGIRTAPNRGLSSATVQELRQNFERDCGEENHAAMRRAKDEHSAQRNEENEARAADQQRDAQARADADRARQQCAEMRLSIQNRKQRANPTEGELKDLERFEERYRDRCGK